MENKINVAELLKDCPKGMELNCTLFDDVKFIAIDEVEKPICIKTGDAYRFLTKFGTWTFDENAKCVIFPKGKTTWEGFHSPFKDGDVVAIGNSNNDSQIFIFKEYIKEDYAQCYMMLDDDGSIDFECGDYYVERLATEEEKQKLFKAIKENGYEWNAETKTLEKLIKPKFKVGDKIEQKNSACTTILITKVGDEFYYSNTEGSVGVLPISEQDNWELVPNKFDISTLNPFDSRVLVRDSDCGEWRGAFWGYLREKICMKYDTSRGVYRQCIPYNDDTKHLLGKTDDCDEFYKTWE